MRSLRITVPACQDLEVISEYFLEISVDAGDRFVEAFNEKCQYLARFPYIGKPYTQLKLGLRGIVLMDYIVFYHLIGEDVEILRVLSGYRDLPSIFSE